jgi:Xaa-Pro dipeptidase
LRGRSGNAISELQFLLGHSPFSSERFEGLFVLRDGSYFYVCPLLSQEEMGGILGKTAVHSWSDGDGYLDTVQRCARHYGIAGKKVAANQYTRAVHVLEIAATGCLEFVSGRVLMEEMRIIKDAEEMENLRIASRYADDVYAELLPFIRPGLTEKDIRDKIRVCFREKGLTGGGLVAVGPNASMPHYNRSDRIIQERDLVLMDYGCTYQGMHSDITRTVFVGEPTEKQRAVYEIVLKASTEAITAIRPGVRACDIDNVARSIIADAGYGGYFLSRLGHGIGYAEHEAPDIKGSNPRRLEAGMAFSIEPGIYIQGEFGIRIEDIILMGPDGVEILNRAPKFLHVL